MMGEKVQLRCFSAPAHSPGHSPDLVTTSVYGKHPGKKWSSGSNSSTGSSSSGNDSGLDSSSKFGSSRCRRKGSFESDVDRRYHMCDAYLTSMMEHLDITPRTSSAEIDVFGDRVLKNSCASDMLGAMMERDEISPATQLPYWTLSPYNPSNEYKTGQRGSLQRELYELRTGQVNFEIDLQDVYQNLVEIGHCTDHRMAAEVVKLFCGIQEQLKRNIKVAQKRHELALQGPAPSLAYCIAPVYDPPSPESPAEPSAPAAEEADDRQRKASSESLDELGMQVATKLAAQIIIDSVQRGMMKANSQLAGSPTSPPRATKSALSTISECSSTSSLGSASPLFPSPPGHGSPSRCSPVMMTVQPPKPSFSGPTAIRRPNVSMWHLVASGNLDSALSYFGGTPAQPTSKRQDCGRVVMHVTSELDSVPELTLAYSKKALVDVKVYLVRRTSSIALVSIRIRNLLEKDSVLFSLKFFAHRSTLHCQLAYPLLAGLHEIPAGQVWEKQVEVHETDASDWCSFEIFSAALRPKRVFSTVRKSVKLSVPSEVPKVEENLGIATVLLRIYQMVTQGLSSASHAEAETMIFAALQLTSFQRPPLQAFLFAALSLLQANRNDAAGALQFCTVVFRLRQLVASSANEPSVWILIERMVSAIDKRGVPSPLGAPENLMQDSHPRMLQEMLGYPTVQQMTEPYRAETKTVLVTQVDGEENFGTDPKTSVTFLLHPDASGHRQVEVSSYDIDQLQQHFTGQGTSGLGRLVFLGEMRELLTEEDAGIEQVNIEGSLPAGICSPGEVQRQGLTPRLLVWKTDVEHWCDVTTDRPDHGVTLGRDGRYCIECPMYPAVALILISTRLDNLSRGLLESLAVPLSLGHRVVFRVYWKPDPCCRSLYLVSMRCEPADAPEVEPEDYDLVGRSAVVALTPGARVMHRLTGEMVPCSEYGETSLSSGPHHFLGDYCRPPASTEPHFTSNTWIITVDRNKHYMDRLRGRASIVLATGDGVGPTIASFAVEGD